MTQAPQKRVRSPEQYGHSTDKSGEPHTDASGVTTNNTLIPNDVPNTGVLGALVNPGVSGALVKPGVSGTLVSLTTVNY